MNRYELYQIFFELCFIITLGLEYFGNLNQVLSILILAIGVVAVALLLILQGKEKKNLPNNYEMSKKAMYIISALTVLACIIVFYGFLYGKVG